MTNPIEVENENVITNEETEGDNFSRESESNPIEEILEFVPEKSREHVERLMMTSIRMGMHEPENEVMKKLTAEHIDKFLAVSQEDMNNSYVEKRENKIFHFAITVVGLVFITAIILILKDNPDVMEKIIYTIGGLVAGAFGGYGYGARQKNNND